MSSAGEPNDEVKEVLDVNSSESSEEEESEEESGTEDTEREEGGEEGASPPKKKKKKKKRKRLFFGFCITRTQHTCATKVRPRLLQNQAGADGLLVPLWKVGVEEIHQIIGDFEDLIGKRP